MTTYPLLFEPLFFAKVWGGRALAHLSKPIPPGENIGESWELADLASTSSGGAGGGSARSIIANGPLQGRSLNDAVALWKTDLLGVTPATPAGCFPLLVKFLDARENLSVQVHPSPAYARSHLGAHLKTESWYILHARPGAVIYKGIKPGVSREQFAAHARANSPDIVDDMIALPAIPGECHNLPSGTVHALGAGVLVAEVQTPSDTTFRLYDWGRTGRELHTEPALECSDFSAAPPAARLGADRCFATLVTTEFYTINELSLRAGESWAVVSTRSEARSRPVVVITLSGHARLESSGAVTSLMTGSTCLIPANLAGAARIIAEADARLLVVPVGG